MHKSINYNKLFDIGHGLAAKNISRMRMGLSPLRGHLFEIRVVQSPICEQCDTEEVEDCVHYLLYCPSFDHSRVELFSRIIQHVPLTTFDQLTDIEIADLLLNGFKHILGKAHVQMLYKDMLDYITNTKRFSKIQHNDFY
jgi:hypothetical protein